MGWSDISPCPQQIGQPYVLPNTQRTAYADQGAGVKTSLLSGSLNIAGLCSDDTALLCKLFMEGRIVFTSYPSDIGMVQLLTTEHSMEKNLRGTQ